MVPWGSDILEGQVPRGLSTLRGVDYRGQVVGGAAATWGVVRYWGRYPGNRYQEQSGTRGCQVPQGLGTERVIKVAHICWI